MYVYEDKKLSGSFNLSISAFVNTFLSSGAYLEISSGCILVKPPFNTSINNHLDVAIPIRILFSSYISKSL